MRTAASGVTERNHGGLAPSRLPPPSPLTTDEHRTFAIPRSEADCDAILAAAESRVKYLSDGVRQEMVADLARFLGAASRIWTPERRERLEGLLEGAGLIAVEPVLTLVVSTPREEVIDAAVDVLSRIVEKHVGAAGTFVEALVNLRTAVEPEDRITREVLLRALVKAHCPAASQAKLKVAFKLAGTDATPSVREVAVQSMATIGRHDGAKIVLMLLRQLQETESDGAVRAAIDDAIEAIEDR